jgi:hypothetical protein
MSKVWEAENGLAGRLWRRYHGSPGVIGLESGLAAVSRSMHLGIGRSPLLAEVYNRWAPGQISHWGGWSGLPLVAPARETAVVEGAPRAPLAAQHRSIAESGASAMGDGTDQAIPVVASPVVRISDRLPTFSARPKLVGDPTANGESRDAAADPLPLPVVRPLSRVSPSRSNPVAAQAETVAAGERNGSGVEESDRAAPQVTRPVVLARPVGHPDRSQTVTAPYVRASHPRLSGATPESGPAISAAARVDPLRSSAPDVGLTGRADRPAAYPAVRPSISPARDSTAAVGQSLPPSAGKTEFYAAGLIARKAGAAPVVTPLGPAVSPEQGATATSPQQHAGSIRQGLSAGPLASSSPPPRVPSGSTLISTVGSFDAAASAPMTLPRAPAQRGAHVEDRASGEAAAEAPSSTQSAPAPAPGAGPVAELDMEELKDELMREVATRLAIERERKGWF